jgi:hypothetical protein
MEIKKILRNLQSLRVEVRLNTRQQNPLVVYLALIVGMLCLVKFLVKKVLCPLLRPLLYKLLKLVRLAKQE